MSASKASSRCRLCPLACCHLPFASCLLPLACCQLPVTQPQCLLLVACCLLPDTCCCLPVAAYLLSHARVSACLWDGSCTSPVGSITVVSGGGASLLSTLLISCTPVSHRHARCATRQTVSAHYKEWCLFGFFRAGWTCEMQLAARF